MIGSQSGYPRGAQGREKSRGYSGGAGIGMMVGTTAEAMMGTVGQCGATLSGHNGEFDENSWGEYTGRNSE